MPQIIQAGSVNPLSVSVPDLYTAIVAPQNPVLRGAPTNVLGVVGVASWGPVDTPVVFGDPSGGRAAFGPVAVRTFDMQTQVATASLQGAAAFVGVRVSDGTDTAASATLAAAELSHATAFYAALAAALNAGSGVIRGASSLVRLNATTGVFSALYTGTVGNSVSVSLSAGSKPGTVRAVVSSKVLGGKPELFDNVPAAAANAPTFATLSLSGGTDGAGGVTSATLVGSNAAPYTGFYALQGQGCAVIVPADCTDESQWSALAAFGYPQGAVVCVSGALGESIATAAANKASAGIDDYSMKVLLGDGVYFDDAANGVVRLVSAQGFWAGKRVQLTPNDSALNKQIYGVAGTQKTGQVGSGTSTAYSSAEIQQLVQAGIDVLTNPAPAGAIWAFRTGHNSSSEADVQSEAYSTMIFFTARTINGGMGRYVGQPISPTLMQEARAALLNLCAGMQSQGLISSLDGSVPYSVVCDATNNPGYRTGLGYLQANVKLQFQAINEEFFVDLEGGATVQIG